MNRLSRQLIGPSSISRALRVRLPSTPRHVTSRPAVSGSRCNSTSVPPNYHPKHDKFDRLFALLRPGMKEDELAMTIAALMTSTTNQEKLQRLESSIPTFLAGLNETRLRKRVDHYLSNPPKHDFVDSLLSSTERESIISNEPSFLVNDIVSTQSTNATHPSEPPKSSSNFTDDQFEADRPASENDHLVDSDSFFTMTSQSILQELITKLNTREGHIALEKMNNDERAGLQSVITEVMTDKESHTFDIPPHIPRLLSRFGLIIPRGRAGSSDEVSGRSPAPRKVDSVSGMDPVELAKRVAADASTNQLMPVTESKADPYPDLMTPDPLMDSRDVAEFPPDKDSPYHNRVVIRNNYSMFHEAMEANGFKFGDDWMPDTTDETEEELTSTANLPLKAHELNELYKFPLFSRRITQQTGKGKVHRIFTLVIVGNGNGLVGYGQGKDDDGPRSEAKAFAQAVRNMDWVERFENRTIWTEMETKLGATRLILRPRPVGFGLRCNPNLHQVLKAAGIKDISAKVWGSRNPLNVIKAAFRMLQSGNAPLSMGDGIGGPGRKLNKGSGLRSKNEVERERGRKLISLRK